MTTLDENEEHQYLSGAAHLRREEAAAARETPLALTEYRPCAGFSIAVERIDLLLHDLVCEYSNLAMLAAGLPMREPSTAIKSQHEVAVMLAGAITLRAHLRDLTGNSEEYKAGHASRAEEQQSALDMTKNFVDDAAKDVEPCGELSEDAMRHLARAEAFAQAAGAAEAGAVPASKLK